MVGTVTQRFSYYLTYGHESRFLRFSHCVFSLNSCPLVLHKQWRSSGESQLGDVMMKCSQGNLLPLAGHPEVYMFIFQWRQGCPAYGHFRVTARGNHLKPDAQFQETRALLSS